MWFEWEEHKAATNERKHGVTFEEAATCFYDPLQVAYYDPDHSEEEDREILIRPLRPRQVAASHLHPPWRVDPDHLGTAVDAQGDSGL